MQTSEEQRWINAAQFDPAALQSYGPPEEASTLNLDEMVQMARDLTPEYKLFQFRQP